MTSPSIGYNRTGQVIQTEIRLFNSLAYHNKTPFEPQTLSITGAARIYRHGQWP